MDMDTVLVKLMLKPLETMIPGRATNGLNGSFYSLLNIKNLDVSINIWQMTRTCQQK